MKSDKKLEKWLKYQEKYRNKNRDRRLEYLKKWKKTKEGEQSTQKYREKNKLSKNISSLIRHSLVGNKNGWHWEDLVGYTLEDLKGYLESKFQGGMSWENYGFFGWHIDHIRPISSFNITDYRCKDFRKCWSLDNLQPLWAKDNLSKGAKL